MKMHKAGMTLAGVVLAVMTATTAFAYKPSGFAFVNYPYLYERTNTEWAYFRTSDRLRVIDLDASDYWAGDFKNSILARGSWSYWTKYPFVYCYANRHWYYIYRNNSQWVRNMVTGQWSLLGTTVARTGEIQFKLTWDKAVDLDLWVTVGGETLKYNHKVGTAGAIGGVLDVDDQDGFGPENVYWAAGDAPQPPSGQYVIFQPVVHYYSGSVDVNWRLEIKATGWSNKMSNGLPLPYRRFGTFRAADRGLTQIPESLLYYGR